MTKSLRFSFILILTLGYVLLSALGPARAADTAVPPAPAAHEADEPEPAPPAVLDAPEQVEGTPDETLLESAIGEGHPDDDKAADKIVVETPEAAAARAEAEHRAKREQERKQELEKAEKLVKEADETIKAIIPYPLNLLFSVTFFDIPLWRYLASLGILFLAFFLVFLIARRFRKSQVEIEKRDTATRWQMVGNVMFLALRNPLRLLILGTLLRGASTLVVTSYHPDIVWVANMLVYLGIVSYFFDMVGIADRVYGDKLFHSSDRLMETVRPIIVKLIRFFILFVAGLQIYQTITGQPMVSLLAGLGIGGLALALASQETLQNLLGFASIALDKSFLVGDAVSIANYDGTVEHVGLRSMRLRTYDGNSIVIPNNTAINSNIVNKTRRPFIRRDIRIALSPLNPYSKVVEAMEAIREVAGEHEGKVSGLPPVVRFVDFEPARFVIQVLFWYDSDKPYFFDECSRVNLEICRRLSEAGIIYAER